MNDIRTHDGYMSRFWDLVAKNQQFRDPMRKAFICVESELFSLYGLRRYRTYESFKTGKWKRPASIRLTVILVGHP